MQLSAAQVLALAPDEASARSGREMAGRRHWVSTGRNDRAAWGECSGSAKLPYQTRVDFAGPAFKCSCPSRKFPCKHGLGLLLLFAAEPDAVPEAKAPVWVVEWLTTRTETAEKKAKAAESKATSEVDYEAAAKRAEKRLGRMRDGLEATEAWLHDLVRGGFNAARTQPEEVFEQQAARLVDAQAPGAARIVQELGLAAFSGEGWQERMLEHAAQLASLIAGAKRLGTLPPALREDVRTTLGLTWKRDELLGRPPDQVERVTDRWAVLGRSVDADDRLVTRRTWLRGLETKRWALLLDFAVGRQPLEAGFPEGWVRSLELAFFPSAAPLRALMVAETGAPEPLTELPAESSWTAACASFGSALARAPWISRWPVAIAPVRFGVDGEEDWLVDESGRALRIASTARTWELAAIAAGRPIGVMGETNGQFILPLAVLADDPVRLVDVAPDLEAD